MRSREDIEAFLSRSGHPHRVVDENTWLVSDPSEDRETVVVRLTEGLVIFRMKLIEVTQIAEQKRELFYQTLLSLNAQDMIHGSYGLSDGNVVIVATLRLENLDFSEFSGTLDDFSIALTNHYPKLAEFRIPSGGN